MATTQRRSLYPPEHPRKRERYYFDDTLDAHPPYHLFEGPSTPEEIAAARAKAAARGLLPRRRRGASTPANAAKPPDAKKTKR